jgi:hypothetical protein
MNELRTLISAGSHGTFPPKMRKQDATFSPVEISTAVGSAKYLLTMSM